MPFLCRMHKEALRCSDVGSWWVLHKLWGQLPFWKGGRAGKGRPQKSLSPKGAFTHCSEISPPLEVLVLPGVTKCSSGVKLDPRPKYSPAHSALHSWQRSPSLVYYRQLIILCYFCLTCSLASHTPRLRFHASWLLKQERCQSVEVAALVVLNKSTLHGQHGLAAHSVTLLPHVVFIGLAWVRSDWTENWEALYAVVGLMSHLRLA